MDIRLAKIKVREIVEGYEDRGLDGVVAYGGNLDVRPKYQREFVYKDEQRKAVVDTIKRGFPLNIMYWVDREDGEYEVLDGQQRTISFCQFITNGFSITHNGMATYFDSLKEEEKEAFLNYELMIYICKGSDRDKLDWFKTVNIAGEKLTNQELRNAVYPSKWLTELKRYFSKTACPAYQIGQNYMTGVPIRQDYLEKVLKWIAPLHDESIEGYMSKNQNNGNPNEVISYYNNVMEWANGTFPKKRKELKGVPWGKLYNNYHEDAHDSVELEKKIIELIEDEEVTKKTGIYEYLLSGEEKHLNIRSFTKKVKTEVYQEQNGVCPVCKKEFDINDMQADHIIPWSKGGKTIKTNCQVLCRTCNAEKSNK